MLRRETKYKPVFQLGRHQWLRRETKEKPIFLLASDQRSYRNVDGLPMNAAVDPAASTQGQGGPDVSGDFLRDFDLITNGISAAKFNEGGAVSVLYDSGRGYIQDMAKVVSWGRAGAIAAQENAPQPLSPPVRVGMNRRNVDDSRDYWLFRGEVYSTDRGVCSAEDVKALALEGENKTKAKLARAHALMAQVDVLEHGGRKPIPDDVKMFVWQRDGGKCVRCGSNRNLEFDHIIPVVMGGANTARNLQLLCEGCNRAKSGSLV